LGAELYTSKDRVRVMIITPGYRIEGDFHVLVGSRITDALNSKTKDYFALTDARIYPDGHEQPTYSPPYIAVNRESIACIFPLESDQ
jgi:hypothetical protein